MSPLPQAVSLAIAGSLVVAAGACRESIAPEPSTVLSGRGAFALSADRKAPTKPSNLRSTGKTSYSVSLAWDASTDNSSFSYRVRDNWGREITVPGIQTSVTWTGGLSPYLNPGTTYSFSVYAVDAAGNKSATSNPVTETLPADTQSPSVPVFSVKSLGTRHITLAWTSTDASPWIFYTVTKDGATIPYAWTSDSTRTFTLLEPATTYTFTAQARDYLSNTSSASGTFSVTTKALDGSDVTPPTAPSLVGANLYGDGSREMEFSWAGSTDDVTPAPVIIYEIYVNGVLENSAIGKTWSSGYGQAGENVISVIAIDEAGNRSTAAKTTIVIPF